MQTIVFQPDAWEAIITNAQNDYPYETCGFFFGREENEKRIITYVWAVENKNQENKERRFLIASDDYRKAEMLALQQDCTLLGIYHSHPNHPSQPSVHDLTGALPFFSYLIISIYDNNFKEASCWRLAEEEPRIFKEEKLIIL
jgi:proteasome lid subunit RPN8/RPN11